MAKQFATLENLSVFNEYMPKMTPITQAAYDLLTPTEKNDPYKVYFITDMGKLMYQGIQYTGGGGGAEIDDTTTALDKVWSSSKVSTELGAKANTSSLATVATSGSYADLNNTPAEDTVLNKSLAANATSLSFTNALISQNKRIDVHSSVYGVNPTNMTVSSTTLTLTFPSSHVAATIYLTIRG